jgi:hypothetical protein
MNFSVRVKLFTMLINLHCDKLFPYIRQTLNTTFVWNIFAPVNIWWVVLEVRAEIQAFLCVMCLLSLWDINDNWKSSQNLWNPIQQFSSYMLADGHSSFNRHPIRKWTWLKLDIYCLGTETQMLTTLMPPCPPCYEWKCLHIQTHCCNSLVYLKKIL